MSDTLTAQRTFGILDNSVVGYIDTGTAACTGQIPDPQCLHLFTDLNTAHTADTFIEIAVQRECFCPLAPYALMELGFERNFEQTQIIGNILQLTVPTAYTGGTSAVMLRQDQLHIGTSCGSCTGRIGMYYHAFFYAVVAGRYHGPFPFHFYAADTTGCDLVDIFQIAQRGDLDIDSFCCLHDRSTFGYLYALAIDGQSYHSVFLPPLKLPKPK